tara:strand:- start:43 stop:258 length:216 start_codon:yes stop_codon:yes gene_type:complete
MKKYLVTVKKKSTHYFEVEAKNKSRAVKLIKERVMPSSMDCRERYGDEIVDNGRIDSEVYITSAEECNHNK